jgi:hypothetical protein
VVVARELDFTLAALAADTGNGRAAASPVISGALAITATLAQVVALLMFDGWHRWAAATRTAALRALAVTGSVAVAIGLYQSTVDVAWLSREPWVGMDRAAGPFFDANAFGALAALGGTWLAGHAWQHGTWRSAAGGAAALVLALGGVVASGSRTAFVGGMVGVFALVFVTARTAQLPRRARLRLLGAAAAAAGVAGMVAVARWSGPNGTDPLSRLEFTWFLFNRAGGDMQQLRTFLWDRDGYGPTSVAMFADHPWVGVGTGAFGIVVSDYAQETIGIPLPPDNAQNWWRQQLSELGVLGGLAAVCASLLAAGTVLRQLWRGRADGNLGAVAATVALGAMAVVSPPTQHPVLQVLAAALVADAVRGAGARGGTARPWVGMAVWGLALTCTGALAVDGWTTSRPPLRASRFGFLYSHGFEPGLPPLPGQPPSTQRRWMGQRAVAVLPGTAPALVIRLELPHADLATAPVEVEVLKDGAPACVATRREPAPVECRIATAGRWVRLDFAVSGVADDGRRGALVTAWYEP